MGLGLVITSCLDVVRILKCLHFSYICAILKLAPNPPFGLPFSIWSPWPWDDEVCVLPWIASTMVSVAISWFSLGELVGMFVLIWFQRNVKVIQPEKVTLLLQFKNLIKPKNLFLYSQSLTLKPNSLSHSTQAFVFCELLSQASAIFFICRMPYSLLSPFPWSSPLFPYHLLSCADNFIVKFRAKKLPTLMTCHKPRKGLFPFLSCSQACQHQAVGVFCQSDEVVLDEAAVLE